MHGVQPICVFEKLRCRFIKCCLILYNFNVVLFRDPLYLFFFTHITEMEDNHKLLTSLTPAQARMSKTQVVQQIIRRHNTTMLFFSVFKNSKPKSEEFIFLYLI